MKFNGSYKKKKACILMKGKQTIYLTFTISAGFPAKPPMKPWKTKGKIYSNATEPFEKRSPNFVWKCDSSWIMSPRIGLRKPVAA